MVIHTHVQLTVSMLTIGKKRVIINFAGNFSVIVIIYQATSKMYNCILAAIVKPFIVFFCIAMVHDTNPEFTL